MFPAEQNNSILWITEGDPSGISYEILEKSNIELKLLAESFKIILVKSQTQIGNLFPIVSEQEIPSLTNGIYSITNSEISKEEKILLGKPSKFTGHCAYHSLLVAMNLQRKMGGNIITLPLSKEWIIKSGIKKFTGHTEALAEKFKRPTFMLMYSGDLNVIPLTTHIPLKNVNRKLKTIDWKNLFSSISRSSLFKNPRIGVCGLNPHAGEDGKIGKEEIELLNPMIKKYSKLGYNITGCHPADSIFQDDYRKDFDIILSCYHDQGLIPFKTIAGKNGVNVTLGLDFIRVSPDHGTAFGIAGKDKASPESLISCFRLVSNLFTDSIH
jgi:4-hydroxythreonine-4-phosphate dehydrogenase